MTQEEYIKQLENTVESLTSQIENLTETVHYLTKKLFGQSSEKNKIDAQGQLGLFDEAEVYSNSNAPEPTYKDVADINVKKVKQRVKY